MTEEEEYGGAACSLWLASVQDSREEVEEKEAGRKRCRKTTGI